MADAQSPSHTLNMFKFPIDVSPPCIPIIYSNGTVERTAQTSKVGPKAVCLNGEMQGENRECRC